MSNRKRRKKSRNAGVLGIGLIVIVFLVVVMIQVYNLKQKDQAYAERKEDLMQQYEEETQRQQDLDNYEAYTKTTDYIESIAKSRLGLAYENEIIFKESKE